MQVFRKYTGSLLLLLFVSYYGGITLFRHAHQLGESKIVHSHPHTRDCGHTHNAAEFQFIQQLSLFLSLAAAGLLVFFGRRDLLLCIISTRVLSRPFSTRQRIPDTRGPPAGSMLYA